MTQRLCQRWETCSLREKILLAGLAITGVLMLVWFSLLSPLMEYQQKGKDKMNKAAQDYLWMADNTAQFDFIEPGKEITAGDNLVQQVAGVLEDYQPGLIINEQSEQQLTLTSGGEPVDFLPLMRFLIYLQAAHNILVDEIDLAAVKDDSNLVQVNKLILISAEKELMDGLAN